MPALQIYYSRVKVSLATAYLWHMVITVQETHYAHLRTIAYTIATNCFKQLNIAYCLCFKTNDRRRNQRAYAENIKSTHTPAAPETHTVYIRRGQLRCPVYISGQSLLGSWMSLTHESRLTLKRTNRKPFTETNEAKGAARDGGDSCLLSASTQTFCDLYIWRAI